MKYSCIDSMFDVIFTGSGRGPCYI